jgi:hypothetical protein
LRRRLERAREREVTFDPAWEQATAETLAELEPLPRREWRSALRYTREGWRRAYDRAPVELIDYQLEFMHAERDVAA